MTFPLCLLHCAARSYAATQFTTSRHATPCRASQNRIAKARAIRVPAARSIARPCPALHCSAVPSSDLLRCGLPCSALPYSAQLCPALLFCALFCLALPHSDLLFSGHVCRTVEDVFSNRPKPCLVVIQKACVVWCAGLACLNVWRGGDVLVWPGAVLAHQPSLARDNGATYTMARQQTHNASHIPIDDRDTKKHGQTIFLNLVAVPW